jgi:transcription elongation factor Elf1
MNRHIRRQIDEGEQSNHISPFLLPTCARCGAAMNLLCVEPHSKAAKREMRTFGCTQCGGQYSCDVPRQNEV